MIDLDRESRGREQIPDVEDARHTREFPDHFMVIPEIYSHDTQKLDRFLAGRPGTPLPDGFSYTSDGNKQWLNVQQIKDFLSK